MTLRRLRAPQAEAQARAGFERIRAEQDIPAAFPPPVEAAAAQAAQAEVATDGRHDLTDIAFVTLDPPGSTDLDQAFHIERTAGGYRVRYAIADVAAFVPAGGEVDVEARARVTTLYAPDRRTPLHPTVLSEGAASLLPGVDRPALVWDLTLDTDGAETGTTVSRALVRSRAQLDYPSVQQDLDADRADELVLLLREVGQLREQRERDRGGATLPAPSQEVVQAGDGWTLEFRGPQPVEDWNAQISLMTGCAAAAMMLAAGVGLLRTLPPPRKSDLRRFRATARALGVDWPDGVSYGDFLRTLDPADPAAAALLDRAGSLFRGAGYLVLPGPADGDVSHAAVAAPYAHCTAPLRRLGDRFVGEICLALTEGRPPPEWAVRALPSLPALLGDGGRRAGAYERACVDLVEALVLQRRVGDTFTGVVTDVRTDREPVTGEIQLREPAVVARVDGAPLELGQEVQVRLTDVSVTERRVRFRVP